MRLLFIYGLSAVSVWTLINLTLWHILNWRSGTRYWIFSCAVVPTVLIGYGVFLLATFDPPMVYDDSMPDPGPENFMFAVVLGFLPGFAYLLISLPLSFVVARLSRPK
jgi:hypothetical protein